MNNISASSFIEQVEIEAKLQISSHNIVEFLTHIDELQILLTSEEKDVKDIYLDAANSLLRSDDRLLRIRVSTSSDGTITELSWKGPRIDREIDTREDISMQFQSDVAHEFVRLLECLGFKPYLIVSKRRREAKIGDYEYELDQDLHLFDIRTSVEKDLGHFVSVCVSIPLNHTPKELENGRNKVMRKVDELSKFTQLESRTFVDLFHQK